jgi:3-oxoacyl-[acyl-carrier-protein] synthase II
MGHMAKIAPLWLLRQLPNSPACHISMEFDARGPNNTITCRDTSTLLALMEAVITIERGAADCMIVGGCGSNVLPVDLAKFCLFEELSPQTSDPETALKPFDLNRDGTIAGEGAAAFVVESLPHAKNRGASIYAEIVGIAAGCDGKGQANRSNGTGLANAVKAALKQARLAPHRIGHINADGKSTTRDDIIECQALQNSLGEWAERIPVTALKSYFGFSEAGSSALELAGSLLALRQGRIPQTLNYQFPDPQCPLNVIHGESMKSAVSTALCINRTGLGQSAAVVLRAA